MSEVNERTYLFLESLFLHIEKLGWPLVIVPWCVVFLGFIVMVCVLHRHSMRGRWLPSLIIGAVALVAHMLDYFVTIRLCPTLSAEANPIWNAVVEKLGLGIAKWYGFTGKALLSFLSFELFAYFLIQREKLLPKQAKSLSDFWNRYGTEQGKRVILRWGNIINFFSFLFALSGPFYFYVAILNTISSEELYLRLPSMPLAGFAYFILLMCVYLLGNYWIFKRGPR
jgi:hypothetical protein